MIYLTLNIVQHYTNKDILDFNIIHKSILNNKVAIGIVLGLVCLALLYFIYELVGSIFNLYKTYKTVNQERYRIGVTIHNPNKVVKSCNDKIIALDRQQRANKITEDKMIEEVQKLEKQKSGILKEKLDPIKILCTIIPDISDIILHLLSKIPKADKFLFGEIEEPEKEKEVLIEKI